MKPLLAATATEAADDQLVEAVRDGSDEAFEALFRRYRGRIVAYVRGMVSDHARAEDITQEAFMSALRGLRSSDQEIHFRPWMYEIAKNACIDHMRRARRGSEVSIDSDDFSPQEEGRISQSVSGIDAEVARRREIESLQMAFGDLPESQHQILVMRELEGLSYDRIGSRMGLSRGAVESLLFRARRTLRDGFDEIDTGERCTRMRMAMEQLADGRRTGMRERRRLSIHLRDCQECRRSAVTIGLDDLALAAARDRGSALRRVAGLVPLPAFLRRRIEDGSGLLSSMGPAAEHGASFAGKAAAVVAAAAIAAGGAGVATKASGGSVSLPGGLGGGSGEASGAPGHGGGSSAPTGGAESAAGGAAGVGGRAGNAGTDSSGGLGGGHPFGHVTAPAIGSVDHIMGATQGSLVGRVGGAVGDTVGGRGGGDGPVSGTIGGAGHAVGSLTGSAGKTVERTGERVGGVVDRTVDSVGGKKTTLPKPKVSLPDAKVDPPRVGGGGTVNPTLPDAGGAVGAPVPNLPVQPPTVTLPQTGVTVPGTGVRLP